MMMITNHQAYFVSFLKSRRLHEKINGYFLDTLSSVSSTTCFFHNILKHARAIENEARSRTSDKKNPSDMQSTLVISNLKGPSETLRDIRTSTYQIFRIEENTNRTTKFNK